MGNTTIRTKMFILIGCVTIAMLAIILAGKQAIVNNTRTLNMITGNLLPAVIELHTISEGRAVLNRITMETSMWDKDYRAQDKFADIVKRKKEEWLKISTSWTLYGSLPKESEEEKKLWQQLQSEWEGVKQIDDAITQTINELSRNNNPSVQDRLFRKYHQQNKDLQEIFNKTRATLEALVVLAEKISKEELAKSEASVSAMRSLMFIVSGAAILSVFTISLMFFISITRPLLALKESILDITAGRLGEDVPGQEMKNELGEIGRALERLRQGAQSQQESNRIKAFAAEVSQALQQCTSFAEFGNVLTSRLAPVMGLVYGAFYLGDDEGNNLQRVGGYACYHDVHRGNFSWGQGLVGQAALDGKTICLQLPSDEAIGAATGMGTLNVKTLLIRPIVHQEKTRGVLELGALDMFTPERKEYLEAALPVIAMSMEILAANIETRHLLEQSQEKTMALAASERQLSARRDELENQKELITQAEERSRLLLSAISEGIFGVGNDGRVTFVNPAACAALGYGEEEMLGKLVHAEFHYAYPDGSEFPVWQCPMYLTSQDGIARTVDNEVLWRKDGTPIPVEYATTPMRKNGAVVGTVVSFRDITERKEAQEYVNAYFNSSTDGLLILSPERGFIHANQTAAAMFGFASIDDLIKCGPVELSPPNQPDGRPSQEAALEYISTAMQMSTPLHFDWIHKRKNGREFPCEITLIKITLSGVQHLLTSIHDITERKAAEQALADQRAAFQQILDHSPVGTAFSVNGIFQYVNPEFLEMFGLNVGDPAAPIYTSQEDRTRLVQEVKEHGFVRHREMRLVGRGQQPLDCLVTFMPIVHEGQPGMMGFLLDITARKAMEETIHKERERLQGIMDSSPIGVAISTEGILRFGNPALLDTFDIKIGDPAEKIFFNPEEREPLIAKMQQDGLVRNHEIKMRAKDGHPVDVMFTILPTTYEGQPGALGWMVDITSLRKMQDELQTAKEIAEAAAQAKADFLANM
ncbi:MAG TPA: hypothetical protein DCG53_07365, partial [Syntrophus sp. (in: bacteria)]|nr:hypothetical protein [Syntrophus sp. (in: bacteria)]